MLQPARRKHRKDFRGKRRGLASRGSSVSFGEFGLKSLECGWMSAQQIEAARRAITHQVKRAGRIWIRVFPDKPITSRPSGQRMGSGKGDISKYVAVVRPGKILFEIAGIPEAIVVEAFKLASAKLPFATKVVKR